MQKLSLISSFKSRFWVWSATFFKFRKFCLIYYLWIWHFKTHFSLYMSWATLICFYDELKRSSLAKLKNLAPAMCLLEVWFTHPVFWVSLIWAQVLQPFLITNHKNLFTFWITRTKTNDLFNRIVEISIISSKILYFTK
jgi:hypothetical protein